MIPPAVAQPVIRAVQALNAMIRSRERNNAPVVTFEGHALDAGTPVYTTCTAWSTASPLGLANGTQALLDAQAVAFAAGHAVDVVTTPPAGYDSTKRQVARLFLSWH